jgi:hypothetical protein
MKKLLIILLTLIPVYGFAYYWEKLGPSDVSVNDYLSSFAGDVLCTSDGILFSSGADWEKYSYGGLPVWRAIEFDTTNIMLIMGDGSDSDGIYKFNVNSHQFEVVQWMEYPHFLLYCRSDSNYYAGDQTGVLESKDGLTWSAVEYFNGKNCLAMDCYQNYFVVTDTLNVYYSGDCGESWSQSQSSPVISDLAFDWNGALYGIFPDSSYSSGLWSSSNFGESWDVEFWSLDMSSVAYIFGYLFVGWERPFGEMKGVAIWDTVTQKLTYLNDGLPKAGINNFSENTLIDCYNVVACTDSGAHIMFDFPVYCNERIRKPAASYKLKQNYPNPFNPSTAISYQLTAISHVELTVYNALGQRVQTLVNKGQPAGSYNVTFNAQGLASGIYFYQLKAGGFDQIRKMILLR